MSEFKAGDRVESINGGVTATVLGVNETLSVQWDGWGIPGTWPAKGFRKVRAFKEGQWVRIIGEEYNGDVGFIIEDDGADEESDPYEVGLREANDEVFFSASELEIWRPQVGERVIEIGEGNEDEFGTVIGTSLIGFANVLWDDFPLSQVFAISEIEPLLDEDENDIAVGDKVEFTNPFFATGQTAEVEAIDATGIRVVWDNPNFAHNGNGVYSRDCFTKIAA